MTIMKYITPRPTIDLSGPEGNAWVLLGYAGKYGQQVGMSKAEIESITTEMMSNTYEHLYKTFDKHFGHLVDLIK